MSTEDCILTDAEREAIQDAACFASIDYRDYAGRQLRLCDALRELPLHEACQMTGADEGAAIESLHGDQMACFPIYLRAALMWPPRKLLARHRAVCHLLLAELSL